MSESGLHMALNHPSSTELGAASLRSPWDTDGKSWDLGWEEVPVNIFPSYASPYTPRLWICCWSYLRQDSGFMDLQSNPWQLFP